MDVEKVTHTLTVFSIAFVAVAIAGVIYRELVNITDEIHGIRREVRSARVDYATQCLADWKADASSDNLPRDVSTEAESE